MALTLSQTLSRSLTSCAMAISSCMVASELTVTDIEEFIDG